MASEASAAPPVGQTAPAAPGSINTLPPNNIAAVSRKKLVSPEVQRIVSVLDECVCKIDTLSLVPCELMYPECVSQELGDTAVELLAEHLRLSEECRSLQDTTKGEAIKRAMQDSLRNFLRHVKPHKEAETVQAALQEAGPITEDDRKAVQELGAGLRDFRSLLMEQLMTTPREERERKRHGQEVRDRQQRNIKLLDTLEQEVTDATNHREKTISKKDGEILNMKDSFHQMKKGWEEFVLQVQKKAEQQQQSDLKNSEMKRLRLQEEANKLQAQLHLLTTQHREKEVMLRKKNNRLETEIENWIQKYDEEMEKKQEKLEHLMQTYEEEQAELGELQEHFTVLELEYTQIMEERQRERERREEEERERETKSQAAIVIQAFWRGWTVRKAMKNKAKTKKGKKGKKGQAKKGK